MKWINVPELAKRWRCSDTHVISLIDAGHLSAVNIAIGSRKRRLIVALDEVERYEEARRTRPRPKRRPKHPQVIEFF